MNPLNVKFKAKIKNSNILVNVIKIDFSNQKVHIGINKELWEENKEDIDFPNFVNDFEDIEELLQWTGFKDKEGNEIYIGDTLTHSGDIEGLLWVCEFDKFKNLRCKGLNEESTTFSMGNGWYISGGAPFVKVIGNVYRED